jgi:hypothetical protein
VSRAKLPVILISFGLILLSVILWVDWIDFSVQRTAALDFYETPAMEASEKLMVLVGLFSFLTGLLLAGFRLIGYAKNRPR